MLQFLISNLYGQVKFGRDLLGPVRVLEHRDSRADQAVPESEEGPVPRECGSCEASKLDVPSAFNPQMPKTRLTGRRALSRISYAYDFTPSRI